MLADSKGNDISQTVILGNSIIGVSILALPYAFQKTGIILGILMFILASWINKTSCYLLVRSAILAKQNSYENLAYLCLGNLGKLLTELSIVGFLLGICAAYFIVIGDLVPDIISKWLDINNDTSLRGWIMAAFAILVILPLSLADKIDHLNRVSNICAVFYALFCFKIFFEALPTIVDMIWVHNIAYWRLEGLFYSLPIIALSLTCQTQIFLIYTALSEPNYKRMAKIYGHAIDSCTSIYIFVGVLGYLAFYVPKGSGPLQGDILLNMDKSSIITDVVIMGFALSSALSFPLSLLPCRDSLLSLVLRLCPYTTCHAPLNRKKNASLPSLLDVECEGERDDSYYGERRKLIASPTTREPEVSHLPQSSPRDIGIDLNGRLKICLTVIIVVTTFLVGLLVPKIEVMLGLIGSLMGTLLACILPALLYLKVRKCTIGPASIFNESLASDKILAQALFIIGIVVMIVGTANYIPFTNSNTVTQDLQSHKFQAPDIKNDTTPKGIIMKDPPLTTAIGVSNSIVPSNDNKVFRPILTLNNLSIGRNVPTNEMEKASSLIVVAGRNILESKDEIYHKKVKKETLSTAKEDISPIIANKTVVTNSTLFFNN